jgi:hypothetical protein
VNKALQKAKSWLYLALFSPSGWFGLSRYNIVKKEKIHNNPRALREKGNEIQIDKTR